MFLTHNIDAQVRSQSTPADCRKQRARATPPLGRRQLTYHLQRSFAHRYPMIVRTAVLELLRAFGMTSVFGNPGSTELPLFHDFPGDFRYVLGLQEAVVVGMADGYAQATHHAAFVNLHSAAGVGHAMGNIFTAFRNGTPLVITAGNQARSLMTLQANLTNRDAI